MKPELSSFGRKMTSRSGILALMDDLGKAMTGHDDVLMLGGGNPAAIPQIQKVWREEIDALREDTDRLDRILGHYDTPQGSPRFLEAIASLFRDEYGWDIGPENVAVTNSSQTAHFMLFNLLAGDFGDGRSKKILLPVIPEYIGYADQGLTDGFFRGCRPVIEQTGERSFKYRVDFDQFEIGEDIAAICVSRPTNPTGNVLTDNEVRRLSELARESGIPLVLDNAYGAPFPNILFSDVTPFWDEHVILTLSLSKLGLPGARTGIIIASPDVIAAVSAANSIISLASGNIGQGLIVPFVENRRILELSRDVVRPFYEEKRARAREWVEEYFDTDLPWRLHECEGGMFFWLWCQDMPVSSEEFYERLRAAGVLVVPGFYFFFGLDEEWHHSHECVRINFSQSEDVVREGLRLIGSEMRKAYA